MLYCVYKCMSREVVNDTKVTKLSCEDDRVQLTLTPFVVVVHPLLLAAELVRPSGHAQALRLGGLEAALGAGDCLVLLIPSKQDL